MQHLFAVVAKNHDVDVDVVKEVYESVWGLMRKVVRELPCFSEMSFDDIKEFKKINKTTFSIPNFCKFFIDSKRLNSKSKKLKQNRNNGIF